MDEFIGRRRLTTTAEVVEVVPGKRIVWQVRRGARLPINKQVVRELRQARRPATAEEIEAFETDVLAGFVLARSAAGLSDDTIRGDVSHLDQVRTWFGRPLWEMEPSDADAYFGKVLRDAAKGTRLGLDDDRDRLRQALGLPPVDDALLRSLHSAAADIDYRPISERGDRFRPMLAWLEGAEEAQRPVVLASLEPPAPPAVRRDESMPGQLGLF